MLTQNKIVLISGGTSGVGKAIAKSFAFNKATVIIIGRNEQRAKAAVNEIQTMTHHKNVSYLLGDLTDPQQNQAIATAFREQHDHLDVLVNSAGNIPQTKTSNINLNLRSHYWLTHNLENELAASDDARIFIITGIPLAIKIGPIYERQKNLLDRGLCLLTHKTLLVNLLADELQPKSIKVNALFPGGVKSDLLPWTKNLTNESVPIAEIIASADKYQHTTGQFFDDQGKIVKLNHRKYNAKRARKVLGRYL